MVATKHTVLYPDHCDAPKELLNFTYMRGFEKEWKDLGFDDDDLQAMEIIIMTRPDRPPVIKGTGGLRKFRFVKQKRRGIRKWCRICYAYFPEAGTVVVFVAYAKNERDDLSDEDKRFYKSMIARESKVLSSRLVR